jgi:hypothetical protein
MREHLRRKIDFDRYERYLTARAIAEAIYMHVSERPAEPIPANHRETDLYEKLCALEQIAEESLVA